MGHLWTGGGGGGSKTAVFADVLYGQPPTSPEIPPDSIENTAQTQ